MAQNTFLDKHVGKQIKDLTFDELIRKLNADVYGKEMRNDISVSVEALGSAVTELHDKGGSGSGVGWTEYQIGQLEKILKAAAYADTGIGDEINKLIASLRHIKVLTSLNIQGGNITLNAGDKLDSIKSMIHVYAVYDTDIPNEVYGYEIEGTLIPGKDCPVSISYTEGGITVTSTIIVTVRKRAPVGISARFFGNQNSLFIGTTADEIKNGVYVYVTYDNGDQERTTDFTLYGDPVVTGMNYWSVKLNNDTTIGSNLRFAGIDPESDPDIMAISAATIDYLLEGCSSTYTNNYIETGRTFSTTITPDRGAIGSVSVFVDGHDHPDMINGGIITINSIYIKNRSRIVISAINSDTCTVSYYLTNCTSSNTEESASYRGGYSTVIIPNDGYELDLEKTYIIMGSNKNQTSNGTFSIAEVTDNIKVYGVAKPASGGEATLTSISASYTGGTVSAGTTLEQLTGITVTATYSDGSTATVTGYTLSGNLTAGQTNTITVTYQGKTATFEVTVEASEVTLTSISASYTGGTVPAGTTLDQLKNHIAVTAHYSDGSTGTVTGYSLSGTLTAGQTNTITVTYQGKTATFSVAVEAESSTETYDLVWNNTTSTANDTSMEGFHTLGSTYTDALSAVSPNKFAAVSNLITYNSSKTYMFKATTLKYGLRFQYGFFDAAGNLVGYTGWDTIGNVGNTVPTTITLNGSTVTLNKNGTIKAETVSTSSVVNIAVFVRGKREVPHGSNMSHVENSTTMYAFEWSVSG